MDSEFVVILKKIITEQGKETLHNSAKSKAFLSDYTHGEYKKESRLLLQALDVGVQKAIDCAKDITNCKLQQIRLLHEDYGLDEKVAEDVVNALALILRGDTTDIKISTEDSANKQSRKKDDSTQSTTATKTAPAAPGVQSLMKRGKLFLEDSDWEQADGYFDRVLDIDLEYAPAYIGKLCADLHVSKEELLGDYEELISQYNHFQKAIRFANANYRVKLEGYNKSIQERIAKEQERILVLNEIRKKIHEYQNCISAGYFHAAGLKADGTVVAVGYNEYGQCNTETWRDIVAITAGGYNKFGLKADGTVVAVGYNVYGQCNKTWRDIGPVSEQDRYKLKKHAEEQRKRAEEQQNKWKSAGLCRYCGGKLSLFGHKCKSCGKEN